MSQSAGFIHAYTDMLSVEAGQEIGLCVSTTADSYSVKIARVGAKTETVWQEDDICGNEFPVPATAFATGCDWPVTLRAVSYAHLTLPTSDLV